MKMKQNILLIIIIAALAGAGVFAYLSFFKKTTEAPIVDNALSSSKGNILPHGTDLNFEKVNKFNQTGTQFSYPQATPADIGSPLNDIISQ